MEEQAKKSFPVIPLSHYWKLRKQFQKSIPTTVTENYVSSVLSMKPQSAKTNVIPSLKMIALVDKEGKTNTELAKKWRDDTSYPVFCKEVRENLYPTELLEAFPDKDSEIKDIERWFANHTGAGESAVEKMSNFYLLLLKADLSEGTEITTRTSREKKEASTNKGKNQGSKKQNKKQKKSRQNDEEEYNGDSSESEFSHKIHIDIQVHISPDATAEQIDQIFSSMAKHFSKKRSN
jgi:hypothetical protein